LPLEINYNPVLMKNDGSGNIAQSALNKNNALPFGRLQWALWMYLARTPN
jgi:hypothetical protein